MCKLINCWFVYPKLSGNLKYICDEYISDYSSGKSYFIFSFYLLASSCARSCKQNYENNNKKEEENEWLALRINMLTFLFFFFFLQRVELRIKAMRRSEKRTGNKMASSHTDLTQI